MAVAITKGYSYLMDPTYRKIFFNQYTQFPSMYEKVFNVETVNRGNWVAEAMVSPLGAARIIPESNPVEFDTMVQGYPVKQYFTKYGLGFQVSEEMQDDDLTNVVSQMPKQLGVSVAYARELGAWDLFNNGMTSTLYTCMDGYAPFYTAHPTLKAPGTTQANTVASGSSLSETPLQAALDIIYAWKDEAGRFTPSYSSPQYLVVPTGLRWMAEVLLKTKLRPGFADNDINATTSIYGGMSPLVVPYLSSTTAWYVVCSQKDTRFSWRRNVKFASSDDFSTGNALFKATARWAVWCYDWRGIFRNPGA